MDKVLENRIYDNHPQLFMDNLVPIYCNGGWFSLIDKLLYDIEDTQNKRKLNFKINTIKEKFGRLRIYVTLSNPKDFNKMSPIYKLINDAEEKSAYICEQCGEPGNIRKFGHIISCSCDKCSVNI